MQVLSATQHSDVPVFQIHYLVGIFHNRTGIRTKEELILTDAYHQRTLFASCDNLIRVALINDGDGIGANHLIEGHLYSCQQVELLLLLDVLDELHQHLRVGIRLKLHALGLQFCLQVGIVLDDTIMNDSQILR